VSLELVNTGSVISVNTDSVINRKYIYDVIQRPFRRGISQEARVETLLATVTLRVTIDGPAWAWIFGSCAWGALLILVGKALAVRLKR
jgi:hypothetical protein